jgi:predicted negative regulator of RcsB-dependent stress response
MAKRVKKKIVKESEEQITDNREELELVEEKAEPQDPTLYDSPEVLQEQIGRTQEYFERNKQLMTGVGVALVLLLAAVWGFGQYRSSQEEEAQSELSPAVFFFEQDSLDKALQGDGDATLGLLKVAEDYSGTDAGNLANFYIGTIYLQQQQFDQAIAHLKDFSASDALVQARAYSLLGDAFMEKADFASAIDYYEKAANHEPNPQFTPAYLMKLALAYEKNQEPSSAKAAYERLVKEYPLSREVNNAKKYAAMF